MQTVDVAVVGGGSTGCSILYNIAKSGEKSTVLLDMSTQLATGQTSRSTAVIRTHYSIEILARMALNSFRFFKNFNDEIPGYTAGYVESGLLIGADEASEDAVRQNIETYKKLGIDSRILEAGEIAQIEPMLKADDFSIMVYEPNSGYADPSTTASAFASAAEKLGARFLFGTKVASIERVGDSYVISTSSTDIVTCKKVVLATGVWSKPIFDRLGVRLPMRVVRHPVAILGRPNEYRGVRPVIFDFLRSAYYKPEAKSEVSVGSLGRELDTSNIEADPDNYDQGINYKEIEDISRSVSEALPIMASKGVYKRGYSGLYDNTPDQQPIIDELSSYGYPGIYCLVGLSGHGFKLSPEFGRIMASLIQDGKFTEYDVSVFKLKRFEEGRLLKGRYQLSTVG